MVLRAKTSKFGAYGIILVRVDSMSPCVPDYLGTRSSESAAPGLAQEARIS